MMIRRSVIRLGMMMVLFVAPASKGQDAQAKIREREAAMRIEAERKFVITRRAMPKPDAVVKPGTIKFEGNLIVNGELIRFRLPVTLVIPEPTVQDQEDPDGEVEAVEPPPVPVRRNILNYALAEENFDPYVFGADSSVEERRSRLFELLEVQIQRRIPEHHLTDAQAAKLRLAGTGDIKRFFDAVEVSRKEFNAVRMTFLPGAKALNNLQPLSIQFRFGPFDNDSLFAKTLAKILAERSNDPTPNAQGR